MGSSLLPAGLLLLALAWFQVRIVRYVTYPPVLFCGVWGTSLLWLYAAGSRYLPIGGVTVAIYVAGAVAFCVGGALGWNLAAARNSRTREEVTSQVWFVPSLGFLVLLTAPIFVAKLVSGLGSVSSLNLLYAVRAHSLDGTVADTAGAIGNVVPFSMMSALVAIALPPRTSFGHIARGMLIVVALMLAVLTGGRGAPLSLILGMAIVASACEKRVPLGRAIVVGLAVMGVFAVMGVLIRKGSANPEASVGANIVAVSRGLEDYALGGIVAFDGVVSNPGSIPPSWSPLRTAEEMANHLGARYEIPSLHAQFSAIGDGLTTNVYTMYFSYYPAAGFGGMLGLVFVVGLAAGFAHRHAVDGSVTATLFHGVLAASVLQSIFNEPFYTNINFLLKLALFALMVNFVARGSLSTQVGATALRR